MAHAQIPLIASVFERIISAFQKGGWFVHLKDSLLEQTDYFSKKRRNAVTFCWHDLLSLTLPITAELFFNQPQWFYSLYHIFNKKIHSKILIISIIMERIKAVTFGWHDLMSSTPPITGSEVSKAQFRHFQISCLSPLINHSCFIYFITVFIKKL